MEALHHDSDVITVLGGERTPEKQYSGSCSLTFLGWPASCPLTTEPTYVILQEGDRSSVIGKYAHDDGEWP